MNKFLVVFIIISTFSFKNNYAQTIDTTQVKWGVLPQKKLVPLFTADARAHRISIQRVLGNNSYLGSMGGIFPLIQVQKNKKVLQLCAAASTYLSLKRTGNHGSVENIDFFADVYLDAKITNYFLLRLGTGHTSQHLSDDAINKGAVFANYARDYHQLFGIYKNKKYDFFVYSGIVFNYNFKTVPGINISNTPIIQFGFEHTPIRFSKTQSVYYAADIKLRGELNYQNTHHFQLGYRLQKKNLKALRIACDYSAGLEERGQYYTGFRKFSSIGLYLEF
ncbi:MAG: hypothetical protein Q8M15_06205 [Bacteroidota bacterium]|nr:hypothetical protein [Bacteroidota bacterium]